MLAFIPKPINTHPAMYKVMFIASRKDRITMRLIVRVVRINKMCIRDRPYLILLQLNSKIRIPKQVWESLFLNLTVAVDVYKRQDPEKEPTANKGVYDLTLKFVDGLTKDELTALELSLIHILRLPIIKKRSRRFRLLI